MVSADLEDVSTEVLRNRKRFASVVLVVLGVLLLTNIVLGILRQNGNLVVVGLALSVTGLPMFMGIQRINGELEKRENR